MFQGKKLGLIRTPDEVLETVPHVLRFTAASPGLPLIADACDYGKRAPHGLWGMLKNDSIGDCFWVSIANLLMAQQLNSDQTVDVITDATVERWYASTGYNPKTGANDNGTDPVSGLKWLQQQGIIEAWGQVDPLNDAHLAAAIELFGGVSMAVDVPSGWMSSSTWGPNAGRVEGGHAIGTISFDQQCNTGNMTWAQIVNLLKSGKDQYAWGAFVVITKQWRRANGTTLQGFDFAGLKQAMTLVL